MNARRNYRITDVYRVGESLPHTTIIRLHTGTEYSSYDCVKFLADYMRPLRHRSALPVRAFVHAGGDSGREERWKTMTEEKAYFHAG